MKNSFIEILCQKGCIQDLRDGGGGGSTPPTTFEYIEIKCMVN